jgi:predicted permease
MNTNIVIKQILSLFLIIIVGFYGRKKNIIDETLTKGFSKLLIEITTPLLIISSFSFSANASMEGNIIKAFIYSLAIFIITPLFIKILLIKVDKRKRNILQFAMVFSNCGFMGFPIAESVFGQEGVIYASIFNLFFSFFVWTYGVMLFTEAHDVKEIKKVFKNPGIIAVFIGIFLMVFSIKIPVVLLGTMKMVGGLTTPISMLIIGSLLATTNFKLAFQDISLYYGTIIKLLIIPGVLYLIAAIFHETSIVIKCLILMQAMPAGAMTTIFAENFDKEKEYAVMIVSFSTAISILTIPFIIKAFL